MSSVLKYWHKFLGTLTLGVEASIASQFIALVLIISGVVLRHSKLVRETEAEVAYTVLRYVTGPALVITTLSSKVLTPQEVQITIGVGLALLAFQVLFTWVYYRKRPLREKSIFKGISIGNDILVCGYPIIACVWQNFGLAVATIIDQINQIGVFFISFLQISNANKSLTNNYIHEDGGVYKGEWKGDHKHGVGLYLYPSSARYEGEWQNNLKEGQGVYQFAKGGIYEGEWRNGLMDGIGVRTQRNGIIKSGRWRNGQLEISLNLRQCLYSIEGAHRAALAAKRYIQG